MSIAAQYRIGVLTLSDKGARGEREDQSGQVAADMVRHLGEIVCYQILPDDPAAITVLLKDWADRKDDFLSLCRCMKCSNHWTICRPTCK